MAAVLAATAASSLAQAPTTTPIQADEQMKAATTMAGQRAFADGVRALEDAPEPRASSPTGAPRKDRPAGLVFPPFLGGSGCSVAWVLCALAFRVQRSMRTKA